MGIRLYSVGKLEGMMLQIAGELVGIKLYSVKLEGMMLQSAGELVGIRLYSVGELVGMMLQSAGGNKVVQYW